MTDAAVAADFHQTLDVHGNLAAEVAFHLHMVLDVFTKLADFVFGKVLDAGIRVDLGGGQDFLGGSHADAVDVGKPDFHTLFSGQVHARNTCH